jgi:PAS domain S-box-containing protein
MQTAHILTAGALAPTLKAFSGFGKYFVRFAFQKVSAFFGVLCVLALLGALLGAIYFTWFDFQWTVFLAGVLFASVLAMAAGASRAEWRIARRNLQLAMLRRKLVQESALRLRAEKELSAYREAARYLDEEMPAMVAYVDAERHVLYHNRAFRDWIDKPASRINQKHLRDVVGRNDYGEIQDAVSEAISGQMVRFERTQKRPDGSLFRLANHYVPQHAEDGTVPGFYAVMFDITSRLDLTPDALAEHHEKAEQAVYAEKVVHQLADWENIAGRLKSAFENDEFRLYCQAIVPLSSQAAAIPMYEILVRLQEEEESLLPPGAFLPIVEEHGLLTDLDRLVVRHLLEWISRDQARQGCLYSVNISGATLSDPDFPGFVVEALRERRLPAKIFCAEFTEAEAIARGAGAENLVRRMRQAGCFSALSQFGRSEVSFGLLKSLNVDYVKIDGNIVLNILRDRVALAKLTAITQVARTMGTFTVAELVENPATLARVREIGVDLAQGFGISSPVPLDEAMQERLVPLASIAKR